MRLMPSEAREMAAGTGVRALVLISSLATGGAERSTVSFMRALAKRGYAAVLCTLTSRDDGPIAAELAASGVVRRDLRSSRLANPLALFRLLSLLRTERIELVHAHGRMHQFSQLRRNGSAGCRSSSPATSSKNPKRHGGSGFDRY